MNATDEKQNLVDVAMDMALDVMSAGEGYPDFLAELEVWLREDAATGRGMLLDPEDAPLLACQLSRSIWNALPNPAQNFRVEKIAAPGRNDRCVAGLDCKHKQCCAAMPPVPAIPPEAGWAHLCEALELTQLDVLLESGRLPEGMLAMVVHRLADVNPGKVVDLLAPRFEAGARKAATGEHADMLLMSLADALSALGREADKWSLLERMASHPLGVVRATACQRLATMHADRKQYDLAWMHFKAAQRADPEDLSLSHLEVTMLLSEGRTADAQARARHWLQLLSRSNHEGDLDGLIGWLRSVIATGDLNQANAALVQHDVDPWTQRFITLLERALSAPPGGGYIGLDTHAAAARDDEVPDDAAALRKDLVAQLTGMGFTRAEAQREAAKMAEPLKAQLAAAVATAAAAAAARKDKPVSATSPGREERHLQSSPALAKVEAAWHQAWPVPKPVSTQSAPDGAASVWKEPAVAFWIEFLEANPLAFESLDVLDDLLIAIELMPTDAGWYATAPLRQRLVERAHAMMRPFIQEATLLPWGHLQNRPGLRLLVANAFDHEARNDPRCLDLLAEILSLNPNDNHGLRETVMRGLLLDGHNADALALADKYPNDLVPGIAFGRALALYRLGRRDAADAALDKACEYSPKVAKWLLPASRKPPKLSDRGVSVGGDDEAWLYRDSMRPAWVETPGALAWLKARIK